MNSETKAEKDIALITELPSGSETALLCTEIREDVWIVDSGASSHMTNKACTINVGCSGEYVDANIIGDVSGIAIQKDGTRKDITLCNVKYVPCLFCKLISLTITMNRGFKMTENGDRITIEKASTSYFFDHQIKSCDGELIRLEIKLGKVEHTQTFIL